MNWMIIEVGGVPQGMLDCSGMFAETALVKALVIPSTIEDCNNICSGCIALEEIPQETLNLVGVLAKGGITTIKYYGNAFLECVSIKDFREIVDKYPDWTSWVEMAEEEDDDDEE